jgi:hypothetical protein
MLVASLLFGVWTALGQGQVTVASSDDLATARALYASGDYEEALTRLSAARTERTADEVDQYRALCLMALGRTAETERSLQDLVIRRPLYKMSDADVSPRLVALFHTVRKRVLPTAAKDLYAKAKASFEQKQFAAASSQLKDLLDLLDDEDMNASAAGLSDLKLLSEGFLKLAEAEIASASAKTAEAAAAKAKEAAAASVAPPAPVAPKIYTDADEGITAPVDINRTYPQYRPPANTVLASREYRGYLRVVIDERGMVESATLLRPIVDSYDPALLAAARQWTFRPALKDGVPVKYLKVFSIVLSPK